MRVLAVVHDELAGPELFGDVIRARGHELVEWQIADASAPDGDFDAVLVLGGRANVGEERANPWLVREYRLLQGWVASGTPLLGVCLGAQTLARAFGARVAPLEEPRAGFYELALTEEGRRDPVLGILPARFEALCANAYAFELPAAAVGLVTGAAGPQGYRIGERAWGVQFHPEARAAQVIAWWRQDEALLRPLALLEAELVAEMKSWQRLGRALCLAFLQAAEHLAAETRPRVEPEEGDDAARRRGRR